MEDIFNQLPDEIILMMMHNLDLKDLVNLRLVNNKFKNIVEETRWPHKVRIKNYNIFEHIISTYSFVNIDLSYNSWVNDSHVQLLSNCHTVNLSLCCLVTDEGIKGLSNCHTVYLSF